MGKRQKRKRRESHPQVSQRGGGGSGARGQVVSSLVVAMPPVPLSGGGIMVAEAIGEEDLKSGSGGLAPVVTGGGEGGEGGGCRHWESGINEEKVRAQLAKGVVPQCQGCVSGTRSAAVGGKDKKGKGKVGKKSVWICLACGYVACGSITLARGAPQKCDSKDGKAKTESPWMKQMGDSHAKSHWKQWQHPVVMQWGHTLECWCFVCNQQLKFSAASVGKSPLQNGEGLNVADGSSSVASGPELLQRAARLLQEIVSADRSTMKGTHAEIGQVTEGKEEVPTTVSSYIIPAVKPSINRRVIKGLMNLGNTCFFNSVMQNLVGVGLLRDYFSSDASVREGTLTSALRKFFQEMDPVSSDRGDGADFLRHDSGLSGPKRTTRSRSFGNSVGTAVTPRVLFSAISQKAPRFKGFQQQDSHELLRCLLDGLHTEEESMRKVLCAVESAGGRDVQSAAESDASRRGGDDLTDEDDASEGEEETAPRGSETFVERMFGGQFSSTVSCCECGHSSVVYEPFLDLSLPIPSKQSIRKSDASTQQLSASVSQRGQRGNGSVAKGLNAPESSKTGNRVVDSKPTSPGKAHLHAQDVNPGLPSVQNLLEVNSSTFDSVDKSLSVIGLPKLGHDNQLSLAALPPVICLPHGTSDSFDSAGGQDLDGNPGSWLDFVNGDLKEEATEDLTEMNLGNMMSDDIGNWSIVTVSPPTASEDVGARGIERFSGPSLNGGAEEGCVFDEPLDDWKLMEEVIRGLPPGLTTEADGPEDVKKQCPDMTVPASGSLVSGNVSSMMEEGPTVPNCVNENPAEDVTSTHQLPGSMSRGKLGNSDREEELVSGPLSEDNADLDGLACLFAEGSSLVKKDVSLSIWKQAESQKQESRSFVIHVDSLESTSGRKNSRAEVDGFHFAGNGGRPGPMKEGQEGDAYPTMSLEGCLSAFTKTEVLSGENAWGCENCTRILQDQLESEQKALGLKSSRPTSVSDTQNQNGGKGSTVYSDNNILAMKDLCSTEKCVLEGQLEPQALEVCMTHVESLANSNTIEEIFGMDMPVKNFDLGQPIESNDRFIEPSSQEFGSSCDSCGADLEKVSVAGRLTRAQAGEVESNAGQGMLVAKSGSEPTSLLQHPASSGESKGMHSTKTEEIQCLSSSERKNDVQEQFLMVDASSVTSDVAMDCTQSLRGRSDAHDVGQNESGPIMPSNVDVFTNDTSSIPTKVDAQGTNEYMSEEDNGGKLEKAGPQLVVYHPAESKYSVDNVRFGTGTQSHDTVTVTASAYVDNWMELPMISSLSASTRLTSLCNGEHVDVLKEDVKNTAIQDTLKVATVKQDATKRFLISKAPPVLTVHLKRFAQDMHGRLSKLSGHVTFHEQLDLGPFMDQRNGNQRDCVYQLIGTVEHSGTMRGGHYVAYVKGPASDEENEPESSVKGASTWYYISDSHVRKTSLESVLQSEAYLLFYERHSSG